MYIACPKCETKFTFSSEQIGNNGRKVKCSKCFHIWHQKLSDIVKIQPSFEKTAIKPLEFDNGVNLPAIVQTRSLSYLHSYFYGLPLLLIGMIMFMIITLFPKTLGLDYILNDDSLGIYDLQVASYDKSGKLVISYKVLNSSNKKRNIPLIRIRLFDKTSKTIMSKIYNHDNIELLPLQSIVINDEIDAPIMTENVDITMGTGLDFILR